AVLAERADMKNQFGTRRALLLWISLGAVCLIGSCDRKTTSATTRASVREPWIDLPPAKWPQFVLTNQASFTGHTPLNGASGFLVRTADGRLLAATAKHLIGENGGVQPEIALAELDRVLKSWVMFPRTDPNSMIEIDRLQLDLKVEENDDLLLMSVKPS